MSRFASLRYFLPVAILLCPVAVRAQTLTFELPMTTNVSPSTPYHEAGFTLTPLNNQSAVFPAIPGDTIFPGDYTGFLGFDGGNVITLTRDSGAVFTLNRVLIGPTPGATIKTTTISIVGYVAGGGTVSSTYSGLSTATTATLNFANLTRVTFTSDSAAGLDDVVLNGTAATAPEAGSLALLLVAGVPAVGLVRRKKH